MKKSPITNHQSPIPFWHPASLIATCGGIGKIPFAPGTFGSVAGVILFFQIKLFLLPATAILFIIGVLAAEIYGKATKKTDASEIVIDEVVGQLITIITALCLARYFALNPYLSERCANCFVLAYIIMFGFFRFFDIIKPFPINWLDRNIKGGMGVMLDDVLAGVFAGITSALVFSVL